MLASVIIAAIDTLLVLFVSFLDAFLVVFFLCVVVYFVLCLCLSVGEIGLLPKTDSIIGYLALKLTRKSVSFFQ